MITPKVILVASVALASVLFTPAAQAKDHRHHHGDRHDGGHHDHGYYDHSYNGYDQGYYYDQGPSVVYGDPYYNNGRYYGERYYGRSNFGVTFAFGGHRHHRHYYHY